MRVQIHLNLAQPHLAENVVRVQSTRGAWIGVAYATQLVMRNVVPVVDLQAQQAVANGLQKKTPHAFLEGDLVHFMGRRRDKAPKYLSDTFVAPVMDDFNQRIGDCTTQVNYNPRFAQCFYRQAPSIEEKFVHARELVVSGWNFYTQGDTFEPMTQTDYVHKLEGTSVFEKIAIARGRKTSEEMLNSIELTRRLKLG